MLPKAQRCQLCGEATRAVADDGIGLPGWSCPACGLTQHIADMADAMERDYRLLGALGPSEARQRMRGLSDLCRALADDLDAVLNHEAKRGP